MKKVLIITSLLLASSTILFAGKIDRLTKDQVKNMTQLERVERVEHLEERLTEIQSMDIKSLDKSDRKETNKELKYIKKELKAHANGGIYISAGTIIIILLLIIIL